MESIIVCSFPVEGHGYQAMIDLGKNPKGDGYQVLEAALIGRADEGAEVIEATGDLTIDHDLLVAYAPTEGTCLIVRVDEDEPGRFDSLFSGLDCTIVRIDESAYKSEVRQAKHERALRDSVAALKQVSEKTTRRIDSFADAADSLFERASKRLRSDLDTIAAALDDEDQTPSEE